MSDPAASPKSQKTLRVRYKLQKSPESPNIKVLKIAKKLTEENWNMPIPSSIQEDFLLEGSKTPDLFLKPLSPHKGLELISKTAQSKPSSLKPTNIVGPVNLYFKKANTSARNSIKQAMKILMPFEKKVKLTQPMIRFDDKIKRIKIGMHTDRIFAKQELKKLTPGGRISTLQQTKSLEAFDRQRNYWKRLEENISDMVQKMPEDLALNSARSYEVKQKEIDVIERVQKMNEKRGMFVWKNSLRAGFYKEAEPQINLSPEAFENISIKLRSTNEFFKNTKKSFSSKGLRTTGYFKSKLMDYENNTDEILNFCFTDLEVKGRDKLRMEAEAARKMGMQYISDVRAEAEGEQVIESNYSPRVLY